jgi:hypothetical protein
MHTTMLPLEHPYCMWLHLPVSQHACSIHLDRICPSAVTGPLTPLCLVAAPPLPPLPLPLPPSLSPSPPPALSPSETCYLEVDRSTGIRAVTTPIDARSPYFVAMRNVSQIENAVAHCEANARGADLVRRGGDWGRDTVIATLSLLLWHAG